MCVELTVHAGDSMKPPAPVGVSNEVTAKAHLLAACRFSITCDQWSIRLPRASSVRWPVRDVYLKRQYGRLHEEVVDRHQSRCTIQRRDRFAFFAVCAVAYRILIANQDHLLDLQNFLFDFSAALRTDPVSLVCPTSSSARLTKFVVQSGAPVHKTENTTQEVAEAFHMEAVVIVFPGLIIASFGKMPRTQTTARRVRPVQLQTWLVFV